MSKRETILALDLATNCGWAIGRKGKLLGSGAWRFGPAEPGYRWARLKWQLDEMHEKHKISILFVEDYKNRGALHGTRPATIYGGFRSIAEVWALENEVAFHTIHPATLKKIATGKGNASKDLMIAAAKKRWPNTEITSHDQADALCMLSAWVDGLVETE